MPSFEEAKKKWLAEIGNKSWSQLADEKEAAENAKVEASMTPEYLAIWKKAAKETDAEGN